MSAKEKVVHLQEYKRSSREFIMLSVEGLWEALTLPGNEFKVLLAATLKAYGYDKEKKQRGDGSARLANRYLGVRLDLSEPVVQRTRKKVVAKGLLKTLKSDQRDGFSYEVTPQLLFDPSHRIFLKSPEIQNATGNEAEDLCTRGDLLHESEAASNGGTASLTDPQGSEYEPPGVRHRCNCINSNKLSKNCRSCHFLNDTLEPNSENYSESSEGTKSARRGNYTPEFEAIYARYPNPRGKKRGYAVFCRIKSPSKLARLTQTIDLYAAEKSGENPKYILHFSTFMNRWQELAEEYESENKNFSLRKVQL